ncbi:hypothetical protein BDZ91DRAFT_790863 [Kalaharituber pfeilii]|nr:hypothetical protein BDZ91DRAFT_790863 [Kalaharituber pfeilii]
MPRSLESSRPILVAPHHRSSTISTPSTTNSLCSTDELRFAEIETGLRRLEDSRMQKQRFVPSEKKSEVIAKLALGAKLDRALRRRMSGQDALPSRRATVTLPSKAQ